MEFSPISPFSTSNPSIFFSFWRTHLHLFVKFCDKIYSNPPFFSISSSSNRCHLSISLFRAFLVMPHFIIKDSLHLTQLERLLNLKCPFSVWRTLLHLVYISSKSVMNACLNNFVINLRLHKQIYVHYFPQSNRTPYNHNTDHKDLSPESYKKIYYFQRWILAWLGRIPAGGLKSWIADGVILNENLK